jgi:nitronate monooxygenase
VKALNSIVIGGKEVLPVIEGGKGVSVSNGLSSGAWAGAGGIGTFSAVNADSFDASGKPIPQIYHGRTRRDLSGFFHASDLGVLTVEHAVDHG